MKLIFEGPDGGGKSTLAKLIAEKLGYNYRGRITRVEPSKLLEANKEDLQREGNWVFDRCYWLSDTIYEPIYSSNETILNRSCSKSFDFEDTILIFVDASDEAIEHRIGTRGDELYSIEQIKLAADRYRAFFQKYHRDHVYIDTTFGSIEQNVEKLIRCINKLEEMGLCK